MRGGAEGWRRKVRQSYDAGQAWIVISLIGSNLDGGSSIKGGILISWGLLVGACIGLNASFLNIITEWLSDIKLGHCTTAFYLNENFCCWGSDEGKLLEWEYYRVMN